MIRTGQTTGAVLGFATGNMPDFDWVARLATRRTEMVSYGERMVHRVDDDCLVIELDAARIVLAQEGYGEGCLSRLAVLIGSTEEPGARDPLLGQRNAFCRLLIESVAAVHEPDCEDWFANPAQPDPALARQMIAGSRRRAPSPVQIRLASEQTADLRLALQHEPEAPEPAPAAPAIGLRTALGVMGAVAVAASVPLGLMLVAWNVLRGADLRVTAAGLALIGLAQGITGLPLLPLA